MPAHVATDDQRARKRNGVHYTPTDLARFLAQETVKSLTDSEPLRVLDPACGDGALLRAFAAALDSEQRSRTSVVGYETDARALEAAERALSGCGAADVCLQHRDFIESESDRKFDAVIVNPPYVRTQVLGAERAQRLAKRFGLTGRVDLAYAFIRAIADALRPGGVLGLLTSNRFLTVKAGGAVRAILREEFDVKAVYDLGDTRLFSAAVLPSIVIATRRAAGASPPSFRRHTPSTATFDRVYSLREHEPASVKRASVFDSLRDRSVAGVVATPEGRVRIERGVLAEASSSNDVWRLSQPKSEKWLARIRSSQAATFGDIATIRVGIKTTADPVFVRSDWDELPDDVRPEPELLRPLITHREASRWAITSSQHSRRVLYPHLSIDGRRVPIELDEFPRAAAYLRSHEARLRSRRYVTEADRRWYEIWVAHDPAGWAQPKIVFPDIAESPRFSLDESGAIVQGDCYWITLKAGVDPDWLPLMLAVANSSVATTFYDVMFHNKLYAGRRRYMTQYVEQFPLPALEVAASQQIKAVFQELCAPGAQPHVLEAAIERSVRNAFQVVE